MRTSPMTNYSHTQVLSSQVGKPLTQMSWRAVWDDFRNWLQLGLAARERT